ncbi:MAG TPA: gamma-glutamyl-gamma-aminobutyrate hydrolase family protein [Candidatus Kapabacteria bacterium]|nr:gamma-glutamyl-gamma-aminobutyrate hydrolase family protein [Candidatus Kapabacteria bacterium]
MNLTIGLSYAPSGVAKYQYYIVALRHAASKQHDELEMIDLSSDPSAIELVDGVLFTGGVDIDPARFGKESERDMCEIDENRDANEFRIAERADERGLPIFGICRGLQMLNVHYGGTLITNLSPEDLALHSKSGQSDRRHNIHIEAGTLLKRATRRTESNVTSAHHQGIENVAPGMKVSARSSNDGIIEAIEWEDQTTKPFFLAVQWHPERMGFDEPLAGELFEQFISEVALHKIISARK